MKKIGFLSFGHWSDERGSAVRSAADVLTQSIELAEAAEALGADGAYFRVHHFARQLGDTVAVMDDGRVVHRGEMAELAADEDLQKRLLGLSLSAHQ